jgi:5-methylcytosine-specific restriction endonuclease McrA
MNRLSKEWQTRPKFTEPKPVERKEYKPIAKVSKAQRRRLKMDAVCADEVMSRDSFQCQACRWLDSKNVDASVVHHIARKRTHLGVEVRFRLGYQIALCEECHADEHGQNGLSRKLSITVEGEGDRLTQRLERAGKQAERTVSDWNPFAEEV